MIVVKVDREQPVDDVRRELANAEEAISRARQALSAIEGGNDA